MMPGQGMMQGAGMLQGQGMVPHPMAPMHMGGPMHMGPAPGGMMPAVGGMLPPAGPAAALAAAKAWKLFVGQISFDLSEDELYPFFSTWGTILELALPRTDGRSRGYAFLTYSSQSEAVAAIEAANGAVVPGDPHARPLTVRWAENRTR
jgi:CUG-BP- and ETR3-like factor